MQRVSGILMPVFSLPSPCGIGDFGPSCTSFINLLHESGLRVWQILPLVQTDPACGNSPYSSDSAFAGNPILISPERLYEEGLISKGDIPAVPVGPVDYNGVIRQKNKLLQKSFSQFEKARKHQDEFEGFCSINRYWLEDFSLFIVLKSRFKNKVWNQWPVPYRDRHPEALARVQEEQARALMEVRFEQFLFYRQWSSVKAQCAEKNIEIWGDLPYYMDLNCSDVWSHPQLYKLDENKRPQCVGGVPPDYFCSTGQLWGNPVYNWEAMEHTGFAWWLDRIRHNLYLYDRVRVDHFRGLVGYWEVGREEKTAVNGIWVPAPGRHLLEKVREIHQPIPLIAEDLGTITDDVREVMAEFGLPGMKILQFAFGEDNPRHPYLPYNFSHDCVVYTGTHDNHTTRGWFTREMKKEDKQRLYHYLGQKVTGQKVAPALIQLALASAADAAIVPAQDVLNLGEDARINTPAVPAGNWEWRLSSLAPLGTALKKYGELSAVYGRNG